MCVCVCVCVCVCERERERVVGEGRGRENSLILITCHFLRYQMIYYMSYFPISMNVIFSAFVSLDMLYMYTHICILCCADSTLTSACCVCR